MKEKTYNLNLVIRERKKKPMWKPWKEKQMQNRNKFLNS